MKVDTRNQFNSARSNNPQSIPAWGLFTLINPINHGRSPEATVAYATTMLARRREYVIQVGLMFWWAGCRPEGLLNHFGQRKQRAIRENKMKKIILLIILMATLASLGGCFWGYPPGHDRGDDRHDRDDRYDRPRNDRPDERR